MDKGMQQFIHTQTQVLLDDAFYTPDDGAKALEISVEKFNEIAPKVQSRPKHTASGVPLYDARDIYAVRARLAAAAIDTAEAARPKTPAQAPKAQSPVHPGAHEADGILRDADGHIIVPDKQ